VVQEQESGSGVAIGAQIARDAAVEGERLRRQGAARRPVRALDVLLDDLERVNLRGGASTAAPQVVDWLAEVESEVGVPLPAWVLAVPDTVRLHAAMLRWQGALLDMCRPERDHIGDLHEDPIDFLLLPGAPMGRLAPRQRVRRQVA
jgi:hypothetical protein